LSKPKGTGKFKKSITFLVLSVLIVFTYQNCAQSGSGAFDINSNSVPPQPGGCTYNSSWATVDDFVYSGGTKSYGYGSATDASGDVFSVGVSYDSASKTHFVTRKSIDHGGTWNTVDDFIYAGGSLSGASSIGVDSSGDVFAIGYGTDSKGKYHYITRRSTDSGTTWATVDDFVYVAAGTAPSYGNFFGKDAAGDIFSVGHGVDAAAKDHYIVRKSTNHGTSWTTVDDFVYTGGTVSQGIGFGEDPSGYLYSLGTGDDSKGIYHGIMRRSGDQGATWTTVDDFVYPNATVTHNSGFGVDSDGNVYVTGFATNSTGINHYLVRKSINFGIGLSLVDDFMYGGSGSSVGQGFIMDAVGDIYTGGYGNDAAGMTHQIARKSIDKGATWTTVDDYVYPGGSLSVSDKSFSMDNLGNIYYVGYSSDSSTKIHFITRSLTCH